MPLSEESVPRGSCSVCSQYQERGTLTFNFRLDVSRMVHQHCSECSSLEVNKHRLCSLCSHVRLSHLLTCEWLEGTNIGIRYDYFGSSLSLGAPVNLESRQSGCAFCQWCLQVAQAESQLQQDTVHESSEVRIYIRKHKGEKSKDFIRLIFDTNTSFGQERRAGYIIVCYNKSVENLSVVTACVDWDVVYQWKAVCEKEHVLCRDIGSGKLPETFRLVDVEVGAVVDENLTTNPKFVALSYVWGTDSSNDITTHRGNLHVLKKRGSLYHVSQTVRHAMDVCKRLGYRYLWVDRLCIVQDDENDKHGQIRSMDAIFSYADLVIVAAFGDSVRSGLPGVHSGFPRGQYQITTGVLGFPIANELPPFEEAIKSVWNQRGWTYQEAVLAKCKLYITQAEVWFECAECIQRESSIPEDNKQTHLTLRSSSGTRATSDKFEDYGRHLENYTERTLSYPSDIYNAFRGIETAIYAHSEFFFGLPEDDFSRALLWYPKDGEQVQERQVNDRNMILPTWSWASIMGQVSACKLFTDDIYFERIDAGSFYCSLCEWIVLNGDDSRQQSTRRINSINDDKVWVRLDKMWSDHVARFCTSPDCRQVLALAWAKGCIETDLPTDLLSLPTDSFVSSETLKLRWPTVGAFRAEVLFMSWYNKELEDLIHLSPGHLLTRTQYSVLRIEDLGVDPSGDQEGFQICQVHNPDEILGMLLGTFEYRLRRMTSPNETADVEFIALAVGSMPNLGGDFDEKSMKKNHFYLDGREARRELYHDLSMNPRGRGDLWLDDGEPGVIVMAIRWEGSIARRMALGWVRLQGWVDSRPEFKTVILG